MMYILGALGGILPDLLRIIKSKGEAWNEWQDLSKYLLGTFFQILIGLLMIYLFNPTEVKDAILYGFSGPQILTSLASNFSGNGPKDLSDESNPMKKTFWFWKF